MGTITTTTTTSSLQEHPNTYDEEPKTLQEAEEIIRGGELFNKTTSSDRLAKLLYPEGGASGRAERRSRLTREANNLSRMEDSPRSFLHTPRSHSSSSTSSPCSRRSLLGSRDDNTNSSSSQRADTYENVQLQNERPPLYSRNSSHGSNTSSLFSIPVHAALDDNDTTAAMLTMDQLDFSVKSSSSSIHSSIMSGYDSEMSNMDLRSIFST